MSRSKTDRFRDPPGLAVRRVAAEIIEGVLRRGRPLDEQLESHPGLAVLEDRDRALARRLIATVLRRLGTLRHLLSLFLERGGPPVKAPRTEFALLIGAAQILWLDVPDHAAVDLAVRIAQADNHAKHFAGLINAVLRRVIKEGPQRLAEIDSADFDTPAWLMQRWMRAYGAETARAIARGKRAGARARPHGEKQCGFLGGALARLRAAYRHRPRRGAGAHIAAAGFR